MATFSTGRPVINSRTSDTSRGEIRLWPDPSVSADVPPFRLTRLAEDSMRLAIQVTRTSIDPARLRQAGPRHAAWRTGDVAASHRALALALLLVAVSRTEAAQAVGMSRQTLRPVHRLNEHDLTGLSD